MDRLTLGVAVATLMLAGGVLEQNAPSRARAAAPKADAKPVPPKPAPPQPASGKPTLAKPAVAKPTLAKPMATGEEKAIRSAAEAFVKAYNSHDAKAVAALFTADAEVVNESGNVTQGRGEIEKVFAEVFSEDTETHISSEISSIRFLAPTLAIEDGTSSVTLAKDEPATQTRYTVLHVKQDGKWLMASARDLPDESGDEHEIEQLEWMIGDWVDEGHDALIVTSTRWSDNHRYILSDFTIEVAGRAAMSATQRIGWDPLAKILRTWVFDSEGGFSEGVYSQDGDQWIVKMTGVTHDGKLHSSTNVTTIVNKDRRTWESRDRMIAGETQPDIEETTIVRKPPKRKLPASANN